MKRCYRCRRTKPLSEFSTATSACRPCDAKRVRQRRYGITDDAYTALLIAQSGRCAICSTPDPGESDYAWLQVDHDHVTGRFRGLLCAACNTMLAHLGGGYPREMFRRLTAAAAYVAVHHPDLVAADEKPSEGVR